MLQAIKSMKLGSRVTASAFLFATVMGGMATPASAQKIPVGVNFSFHGANLYRVTSDTTYCQYTSPTHFKFATRGAKTQVLNFNSIPDSMELEGKCYGSIPGGNFKYQYAGVYYSDGQGSFCRYSYKSAADFNAKSVAKYGQWLDIQESVPFTDFMQDKGTCPVKPQSRL